ncbi:hypothetical protein TrLO_g14198 [Triparma laevis f. longispina]|uniref:Uncharacterized protein n=1 Tax=Triparma laevis f. longispina TaxID=1714387 RepID=A0A9W7BYT2_9STRA|nr:hypothetical protein TrLO_g14198 [Triparma laevis f. longispina]
MSSNAVKTAALWGAAAGALVSLLVVHLTKQPQRNRPSLEPRPSLAPVTASGAAPAGGHYSQAMKNGSELFISGLLPITSDGVKLTGSPIEDQVKAVLNNMGAILKASGSSPNKIISVRVYLADFNHENWAAFNKIYNEFVGDHKPARAVVPVPTLHHGFLVEVEAIAAL